MICRAEGRLWNGRSSRLADEPIRPRAVRSGPFGVLDIGSTKIACLIGRAETDGRLRALGFRLAEGPRR